MNDQRSAPLYGGAQTPRVAIIGAGLGGIAVAVNLAKRGIDSFTIFEKSEGPGGTWWDNRYPGAECDVMSELYSYSFKLHHWSRTHARQPEIQAYVQSVVDAFGLGPRIRYGTAVERADWDEEAQRYDVLTADGQVHQFDVVVSAVGLLNVPRYPDWPGLDTFEGPAFHTARWEHDHDLAGKRVAVVGAGSTASQVVPAMAQTVGHLLTFQREAAWVLPKGDHDYSAAESARLAGRWRKRLFRAKALRRVDAINSTAAKPDGRTGRAIRQACLDHLDETFHDKPDLKAQLTPSYPVRCKRLIMSSDFLPALARDNVELVARSVVSVTPRGVVDDLGEEHPVDAIIIGTGFQPWNFLAHLEVTGRGGRGLHETWGDEPSAFLGLCVPGFPNFFMLYGPNTNGGVVSFTLERQAEFVARSVASMRRRGACAIEVRPRVATWYAGHLTRGLAGVATWEANCHNYYHSASGKNVTQWPWTHVRYAVMTRLLRAPAMKLVQEPVRSSAKSAEHAPAQL